MNKNYVAIDYLRTFITVLVVAHHSVLAYVSYLPSAPAAFTKQPYLWGAYPVVDSQRWGGFDIFAAFNDAFFMSLMFLLAGLFVWPNLSRKESTGYLKGRLLRLGLPFVVGVVLLSPLAYYPAYLLGGGDPIIGSYFKQWLSLDYWPPGPCWFIAVLLGFDVLATLMHKFFAGPIEALGKLSAGAERNPARLFFGLTGVAIIAYLAMVFPFGPSRWFSFGPFAIQASRVGLYATYFFAGVGLGASGIERGLLADDGQLAKRWLSWLRVSIFTFLLFAIYLTKTQNDGGSPALTLLGGFARVLFCGTACFCLLAIFVRFAKQRVRWFDSLCANAYGIFLIHYVFVAWIQYALLDVNLTALAKGMIAFVTALSLSWASIAAIRCIPCIDRILSSGNRLKNETGYHDQEIAEKPAEEQITPPGSKLERLLARLAVDKLIALIAVLPFLYLIWQDVLRVPIQFEALLIIINLAVFSATMLLRQAPKRVTLNPLYWLLALAVTYWPFLMNGFYEPGIRIMPELITLFMVIIGLVVTILARLSLGRNIGLVPAERRIVCNGLYAYIRHPIYAGMALSILGWTLADFSFPNMVLNLSWVGLMAVLALAEECFLRQSEAYRAYLGKVSWRWVRLW